LALGPTGTGIGVERTYDNWRGQTVMDVNGDKVGSVEDVYYDDVTGRPEWLGVKTGLFGMNTTLVPISGTQPVGDGSLTVPYEKAHIKDAPNVEPVGGLDDAEEEQLYRHYGFDWSARGGDDRGYGADYATRPRADADYRHEGEVVAEATAVDEQAKVTEKPRTVRLRKYRWTEEVPVQREEVRVEGAGETTRR
jgi:sporulation protein YlmC with PRC-barrel domain